MESLETLKHRFIIDVMHFYSRVMGIYEQMPGIAKLRLEYGFLSVRRLFDFNTAAQEQNQWKDWKDGFSASILQKDQSQQENLISAMLRSRDIFPLSELWAEGSFLMLAGMSLQLGSCSNIGLTLHTQDPILLPQPYLAFSSTWRTIQTFIKDWKRKSGLLSQGQTLLLQVRSFPHASISMLASMRPCGCPHQHQERFGGRLKPAASSWTATLFLRVMMLEHASMLYIIAKTTSHSPTHSYLKDGSQEIFYRQNSSKSHIRPTVPSRLVQEGALVDHWRYCRLAWRWRVSYMSLISVLLRESWPMLGREHLVSVTADTELMSFSSELMSLPSATVHIFNFEEEE